MEEALSWLQTTFDVVLALTLIGFAAILLATKDLLDAIVLFILFGLLMSVTWGRLGAIDIALAEAAIGAGITGAMFLNARGDLEGLSRSHAPDSRRLSRLAFALGVFVLLCIVVGAVAAAPLEAVGMRDLSLSALPVSGVTNPVTAVLLNHRAYDTLLELTVLLVAVVGTWSQRVPRTTFETTPVGPVLLGATRLLVPLSVLIGGYLLWRGSHVPGGAFQAGAVLAGAGVLLLLIEHPMPRRWGTWPLRLGLASGVLFFTLVGLSATLGDDPFLFHRDEGAARRIVAIEIVATVAIAVALVALLSGRSPHSFQEEAP
jgi:multisubunit Na+/H+ antiporter MnhB subunit